MRGVRPWALRQGALMLFAVGLAVLAFWGATLLARAPVARGQAGVVPPTLFGMYGGYQSDAEIARVRDSGARLMRVYVEWASLQPYQAYGDGRFLEPTTKDQLDAQLRRVNDAGMTPVLLVGEAPDWAAPRPRGPLYADKLPYYVRLMEMLTRAYKDAPFNVRYWELWPEPDAMDTIPPALVERYGSDILKRRAWGNNGAQYAAMLKEVYPAIKRADPGATVLIGAIAYDWFGDNSPGFNSGGIFNYLFLDDVLAAGGGCCFDVLAFNSYAAFAPGWEEHAPGHDISAKANYLADRLQRLGVRKPLMVLEAGLWTSGSQVPKRLTNGQIVWYTPDTEAQSAYVTKLYARAASVGLLGVAWYTFRDQGYDSDKRGLVEENLAPKPSLTAYRLVADKLRGTFVLGLLPRLSAPGGVGELEGYQFQTPDARQLVLAWIEGAESGSMSIDVEIQPHVPKVKVYDIYRQSVDTIEPRDGKVTVQVTTRPIYIEEVTLAASQVFLPIVAKSAPGSR